MGEMPAKAKCALYIHLTHSHKIFLTRKIHCTDIQDSKIYNFCFGDRTIRDDKAIKCSYVLNLR